MQSAPDGADWSGPFSTPTGPSSTTCAGQDQNGAPSIRLFLALVRLEARACSGVRTGTGANATTDSLLLDTDALATFDAPADAVVVINAGGEGFYRVRYPEAWRDALVRSGELSALERFAIVDDAWATIGSTNVADRSFRDDTELNASFWDEPTVRALREALLAEHLGVDTAGWGDRKGLRLFREIALANRARRGRHAPLAGLVYAVDPTTYGVTRP